MGNIRMDKYLADMGLGTRSEVKKLLKKGCVCVNGETEKKPERKVDPKKDQVTVDGVSVSYEEYEYYMLNKPQGVVSATEDRMQKTVLDCVEECRCSPATHTLGRVPNRSMAFLSTPFS